MNTESRAAAARSPAFGFSSIPHLINPTTLLPETTIAGYSLADLALGSGSFYLGGYIAERAASWAASAKVKRMPLEKWLAEERYDEADRRAAKPHASDHDDEEGDDMAKTTRADRHRAEIDAAKRADALAEQKRRESIRCQVPFGTTFVANASEFVQEDGTSRLILHTSHGEVSVILESPNSELQDAGQRHLSQLTTAAGLGEIDDSAELHGIPIVWTKKGFASAREVAA